MKFLLDYVFAISVIPSVPAASTAFLKQVLVIAKPKSGQEGNVGTVYECTTMAQVLARTDNENAEELFSAGMSKVYVMLSDDLDVATYMEDALGDFWTVLISDDFTDADVEATAATGTVTITSYANLIDAGFDTITVAGVVFTAQAGAATLGTATFRAATSNDATATSLAAQVNGHATAGAKVVASVVGAVVTFTSVLTGKVGNTYTLVVTDNGSSTVGATRSGATLTGGDGLSLGDFDGVVGYSTDDADVAADFGATENRSGWFTSAANGAKNMFYAFGKLLSNQLNWQNQQYITMPYDDGIDNLGEATSLYDDRVCFVLNDDEFGKRLGLFVAGGKAIAAPYIGENLRVDLQSTTLSWIAANQPTYTKTNAALLEQRLQEDVINVRYINTGWIEAGRIEVELRDTNFVAAAEIDIAEPKALWRMFGQMQSTL
jgi:hypothetical protein